MNVKKVIEELNKGRATIEGSFIFALWKNPELYADYADLTSDVFNEGDAKFYFTLGKNMYLRGIKTFDPITVNNYLEGFPEEKKRFESYGGVDTMETFQSVVTDYQNADFYFDKIATRNYLTGVAKKIDKAFGKVDGLKDCTQEELMEMLDGISASSALASVGSEKIENLTVNEEFIAGCMSGKNMGYKYSKSPILNYITSGAPKASMFMIGGHSGVGKSSFTFEQMLMSFVEENLSVGVISNEMKIDRYQTYLLEHILVNDMNYYGLTTKKIRLGEYTNEQKEKIEQAIKISEEKYLNKIKFIKMFNNHTEKILKYMRQLNAQGVSICLIDTFKIDDDIKDNAWLQLSIDARKIFQCASKLEMCVITTYQLALHTLNQRFLDVTCLSNSKQIKEIYETMIYCRWLWHDEYPGEKYDVKPYKWAQKEKGKPRIKEFIELDPDKKYVLFFVDKTRSDDSQQVVIYEWQAHYNKWIELGYASVTNTHRSF